MTEVLFFFLNYSGPYIGEIQRAIVEVCQHIKESTRSLTRNVKIFPQMVNAVE